MTRFEVAAARTQQGHIGKDVVAKMQQREDVASKMQRSNCSVQDVALGTQWPEARAHITINGH